MRFFTKLRDGVSSMTSATAVASQGMADRAIASAVSQLLTTMNYASQKIAEADDDLPEGTMLRVSASALLVEISLEVPINKGLKDGQNSIGKQDEVVREEALVPDDAHDPYTSEG